MGGPDGPDGQDTWVEVGIALVLRQKGLAAASAARRACMAVELRDQRLGLLGWRSLCVLCLLTASTPLGF